jgi:predicted TIM-barrel fold metal-dependent hydrolase
MDSMRSQIPDDFTRRHFLRGLGLMGAGSLVAPFEAVRDLVGIRNMLLGSDYPYGRVGATVGGLARLNLPAADLRAIERDNALALLPSLPS